MHKLFPLNILKEGLTELITPFGGILVLISFVFSLGLGILSLLVGVLIFGPTTLLLGDRPVILWMILPFLYVFYFFLLVVFVVFQEFFVLFYISRREEKKTPLWSIDVLQEEGVRLKLYLVTTAKAFFRIKTFFHYFMVWPISMLEYQENLTSDVVLARSEKVVGENSWALFYFFLFFVVLYLLAMFFLGRVITQLLFCPILLSYFALCLIVYFKRLKS